ncbi:hypothetical protein MTBUT4_20051 [Magnetospirillum sp. UT-4]|nr:hypothetical protein MTBUT4_20051 [Magnetospirillum sp. UT-4]
MSRPDCSLGDMAVSLIVIVVVIVVVVAVETDGRGQGKRRRRGIRGLGIECGGRSHQCRREQALNDHLSEHSVPPWVPMPDTLTPPT